MGGQISVGVSHLSQWPWQDGSKNPLTGMPPTQQFEIVCFKYLAAMDGQPIYQLGSNGHHVNTAVNDPRDHLRCCICEFVSFRGGGGMTCIC